MSDKALEDLDLCLDKVPSTGTYAWNPSRNIYHRFSRGLMQIYGLTRVPNGDQGFLDYVHPDDRLRVEAKISVMLESGATYSHTFRIIRPDGQVRTILDRGAVDRGPDGTAILLRGVNIDITAELAIWQGDDRPQRQRNQDETDRMARAGRAAGFGAYEFDLVNGSSQWSEELLHILGRPDAPRSGSVEMALQMVHPDDRPRVREEMGAALRAARSYDLEYRIIGPDQSVKWVRDRGEVITEAKGFTPLSAIGLLNDITPRKQAEEALLHSNALLAALFDKAPVGMATWDRDFRYTRVNDRLAAINGLPASSHIGKRTDELLPDLEGLDALHARFAEILRTGEPSTDVEIRGKTLAGVGPRIWNVHFFPIRGDKEVTGIAAIAEDVTDRKEAERVLEESSDRLRRILDESIAFVGVLAPDGTVIEANETALRAGGLTRDAVIGQKFWDTRWWNYDPQVADQLCKDVLAAAEGTRIRRDAVARMAGDTRMTIDMLLAPVFDPDGSIRYVVPSGFDVTPRNAALDHVRLLMAEMNHRSKNMLSLVQAIARQTMRASPEDFIAKFGDRMRAMARAQDLLINSNWNSVDLHMLIRAQLALFKDAPDKRIFLSGPAVMLTSQAAQGLSMVLHELATNAIKYGALSVRTGRVDVTWSVEANASDPLLSLHWIESDGPAVAPPSHKGFGSTLIETMVQSAFGTTSEIDFAETGLRWHLRHGKGCMMPTEAG